VVVGREAENEARLIVDGHVAGVDMAVRDAVCVKSVEGLLEPSALGRSKRPAERGPSNPCEPDRSAFGVDPQHGL